MKQADIKSRITGLTTNGKMFSASVISQTSLFKIMIMEHENKETESIAAKTPSEQGNSPNFPIKPADRNRKQLLGNGFALNMSIIIKLLIT